MTADTFAAPVPGILRIGTPLINWYLVADDSGVTVVDAGSPDHRPQLERLEGVDASVVILFGHGDGWTEGSDPAVRAARSAGRS